MASEKFEAPDLQKFIASLRSDTDGLDDLWHRPEPELLPVPTTVRGFRIRIDLQRTKPPVWRRIDVPGDILLPRLHEVIQAAMGWTDSHLHRFRTSNDRNAPEFLTQFDLDEGDEGMLEDDVRLDQILSTEGDRLWYDYDFGDDWKHLLRVEKVLDSPPPPRCASAENSPAHRRTAEASGVTPNSPTGCAAATTTRIAPKSSRARQKDAPGCPTVGILTRSTSMGRTSSSPQSPANRSLSLRSSRRCSNWRGIVAHAACATRLRIRPLPV